MVFTIYSNIQRWMSASAGKAGTTSSTQRCITAPSSADDSLGDDEPRCRLNEENETNVNTVIISASIRNRDRVELRKPFEFTLEHIEVRLRHLFRIKLNKLSTVQVNNKHN